jgi:hypothetical protein
VAQLVRGRTLHGLGLGLGPDVFRRIADRPLALGRFAAEEVAALDVQISVLRLRWAMLSPWRPEMSRPRGDGTRAPVGECRSTTGSMLL